jgi:hypothetical protein
MFTNRRRIWNLFVITTLALTSLSVLPASQPLAVRAAGNVPTGLQDYEIWFGSQHTHIGMDGDDGATGSTAANAFSYAKNLPFLKYYIVTPHVHAGRSVGDTTLYSDATYNTIRSQADSAMTTGFVAIAGQEVSTISSGGHWNLYNASSMVGTDHPDGDWNDSNDYYEHVAGLGAAGEDVAAQFNHMDSGNFGNRYDPNAAPYFGTYAVSSGYTGALEQNFANNGSNLEYATNNPLENLWASMLNLGWKLSPSADQDNHRATWGASSTEYTVIVRPKGTRLDRANVLQGLRQHMTYATEDANMQIGLIANGWSMGQTAGGDANVAFTIWWNNPSATICNNNVPVCASELANDVIQNIWIYKNAFGTSGTSVGSNAGSYVARYQPNTASGAWNVTLPASVGDWFVVKFQDTYTFATDPTYGRTVSKDLTWSAPVWYDPANADVPITVGDPTTPPAAPTNLTAVGASSSQVNLSWTDSDTLEQGFKIERCTGAECSNFAEVASVGANVTGYSDSGLAASSSYSYRVRAYNVAGDSGYSNTASAVTQTPPTPPNAPTSLSAIAVSSSQINLTWTDNAGNETGFKVDRCTGAGCTDFTQVTTLGANVTSYSDPGLAPSTSYSYRVMAYNAVGASDYSNVASAVTAAAPSVPNAPTNLVATVISKSQINLTWADNSTNETGFRITRCKGSTCTNFALVATVGANVTSYQNTRLTAGTTYSYRIYAYNAVGNSGYSNIVTAATPKR